MKNYFSIKVLKHKSRYIKLIFHLNQFYKINSFKNNFYYRGTKNMRDKTLVRSIYLHP